MSSLPISESAKTRRVKLETFIFYGLFILSIFFVYKLPREITSIFFLILLGWAWFSKKTYFWIAFFFVLFQEPGYFFRPTPTSRLPIIQILPSVSITLIDMFTILMLMKIIFHRKIIRLKLKAPLLFLGAYFLIAFFIGGIFHSISLDSVVWFSRQVVYYTWIIFFVAFLESKEDVFAFLRLIFPIIFFILFTQFYFLISGTYFVNLFDPYAQESLTTNTLTGELRPLASGALLVLLNYIGALFFLQYKERIVGERYLYFIVAGSFFSIFLSSTRMWFGMFLFIMIGVFFRKFRDLPKMVIGVSAILSLILFSIKFGFISEEYLRESVWQRIAQGFQVISGGGQSVDTFASRLAQLNVMLDMIRENLLFGYGFSDTSRMYYNSNWGFFNTILMFGLCGFSLYLFLCISYIRMIFSVARERVSLRVLLVSFYGMLIGYFLTYDFFSFMHAKKITFIMVFLGISEIFCNKKFIPERQEKNTVESVNGDK